MTRGNKVSSGDWRLISGRSLKNTVRSSIIDQLGGLILVPENTLLRYHQLSTSFRQPQRRDVEILAGNLDDPKLPDYLLGRDSSIWKDESLRYDLISIHTSHDFDIITKWLIEILLRSYHQLIGRRKKIRKCSNPNADADLFHYDDDRLEVPATVISTVLASLLPTLSIVVLYIVHNMPARLALVAALTTIFSVGVAVLTKARRVDIFAATAAYVTSFHGLNSADNTRFAAVQVVFIGTNVPGSSGNGKTS